MKPSLWSRFIKWCGFVFDSISNFISRNFGSNVGLKILSVFLSFIIIHVVSERIGVGKEFMVPVKITMKTKNTALSSYSPSEVKISLKGALEDLSVVDDSLLVAEIVIHEDYKSGQKISKKLYSTNIKNNGNLRVEDISPDVVDIVFDKEARRKIPVALPSLEGKPLQEGTASVRFVSEHEVTVVGSELGLKRLEGVGLSSRPIDVSNRSNSFEHDVEVLIPPDAGVKSIESKKLKVFVEIELPQTEDPIENPEEDKEVDIKENNGQVLEENEELISPSVVTDEKENLDSFSSKQKAE